MKEGRRRDGRKEERMGKEKRDGPDPMEREGTDVKGGSK